jgi:hypothetical protein
MIKDLQQLFRPVKSVMRVEAVHPEGTLTVSSLSGHIRTVIGTGIVGQNVYVEAGRVIGEASNLVFYEIEI